MNHLTLTDEQLRNLQDILRAYANENPQYTALNGYPQDPNGVHSLLAVVREQTEAQEEAPPARVVKERAMATIYVPTIRLDSYGNCSYVQHPEIAAEIPVIVERAYHPSGEDVYGTLTIDGGQVPVGASRLAAESIPFLMEAIRMDFTFRSTRWG